MGGAESENVWFTVMERKRILFVDDDPLLLAGLRNVLKRDAQRWDMTFALGGEAGLVALSSHAFDCVVTDLRMPVVDGAVIVENVKQQQPRAACVMLSGSDCEVVAGKVDELLFKPCSAATLRATLERLLRDPI